MIQSDPMWAAYLLGDRLRALDVSSTVIVVAVQRPVSGFSGPVMTENGITFRAGLSTNENSTSILALSTISTMASMGFPRVFEEYDTCASIFIQSGIFCGAAGVANDCV